MSPPATWNTVKPQIHAINSTANKIVQILIFPSRYVDTAWKSYSGLLEVAPYRASGIRARLKLEVAASMAGAS
jgi:hypothetical protein